jgi:predicted DNA-binding protein YlxM (UPF0122 family)
MTARGIRTKKLAKILETEICEGKPLRQICREQGVSKSAVYDWIRDDGEFAGRIARAREIGFDDIAETTLEIADKVTEDPASRRVRVWTRLQLLAKWDPRRYGERLDLTSGGEKIETDEIAVATRLAAIFSGIDKRHASD